MIPKIIFSDVDGTLLNSDHKVLPGTVYAIRELKKKGIPFVIISASEGTKVLLGKKPGKTGLKDGAFRMVKTGAAMGVGAAVGSLTGFWAAIPVTMGVRALFDRYRSKALTGRRVKGRIDRLKELNKFIRRNGEAEETAQAGPAPEEALTTVGQVE